MTVEPRAPESEHSPQYFAGVSLIRTADRISNRFGRLLRDEGLTNQQYNVLRILRREGRPLPSLEVAERLIQQVPAITGLIDRLEKQKYVVRRRCDQDRRVIWVESPSVPGTAVPSRKTDCSNGSSLVAEACLSRNNRTSVT